MYIGLTKTGQRLVLRKPLHLWWKRGICLQRQLSSSPASLNWRNETPPGGLTEIFVYKPESQIAWPDSTLGIFAQADPKFVLPGNVGVLANEADGLTTFKENTQNINNDATSSATSSATESRPKIDVLEEKTLREHQAQTLYSAHDYIQYTQGSESYVCSNPVLLEDFPSAFADMAPCRFELHDAPQLLKKELTGLFPGVKAFSSGNSVSVITMARETQNDMSTWSDQVEDERDLITDQFVSMAKEVCTRLKYDGYWADFIDPTAGIPFYTANTNGTMFETDEKYRLLGFRIEDLGCCKVICHRDFGRNVFVGSIFTSVPIHTGVIQDIFQELNLTQCLAVFQSEKKEEKFPSDLFA